jgi:hypothetical protein
MRLKATKKRLSSVEHNFITTQCLETAVILIIVDSQCQIVYLEFSLRLHYHNISNFDHVFLRHFIRRHS